MSPFVIAGAVATGVITLAVGTWIYMVSNVETPEYAVVESDGAIEVRDYGPQRIAEIIMPGTRQQAVSRGFSPLAGYIFAKERQGDKIAMTAPVTQQAASDGSEWRVHFIMPDEYSLDDLPTPADARVTLKEIPSTRRAAIRFSGIANDKSIAEQEQRLRTWLQERDLFEGDQVPVYAYYNDPFTPPPLRRNEVMFLLNSNDAETPSS